MKTVHGVDFYVQGGHKKRRGDGDMEDMEEARRWGAMEGGCHPMTPMTPNSNGSGSPKIKTEVTSEE